MKAKKQSAARPIDFKGFQRGMALVKLGQKVAELAETWGGTIDKEEGTNHADVFKSYGQSFLLLLAQSSANDDELLFEELARLTGVMVETLWAFAPDSHLSQALPRVDPWPLALSGHPDFLHEWESKKELLRDAFKKGEGLGVQRKITPKDLPGSRAAMAEIIESGMVCMEAGISDIAVGLGPCAVDSLPAWQKAVTEWIQRHPEFPEGEYFRKVNRGENTITPGQRAEEIRKAVREYFRTLKRKLEAEK